jgi:hypothetical protein
MFDDRVIQVQPRAAHVCTPRVDDLVEKVLSVLLSSAYRKNSLTAMHLTGCRPAMMSALRRCIGRALPIALTVLAFPFKVPNPAKVGDRKLPDFAAIRQCLKLSAAIQRIYPPGLAFHILHDGRLMADVFELKIEEVRAYETYFSKLVEMLAPDVIRCHDFGTLQQRSALDPSGATEKLRFAAERWFQERRGTPEWNIAFRRTLGMINLRKFPAKQVFDLLRYAAAGRLPSGWEKTEQQVFTAMKKYYVADAIIHRFDPRPLCFPDAIQATTQDRQGRLALWMVRRGQSLLPWHGVGCFDEFGRAQVVHAIEIRDREDYCPVFVRNETTPFVYHKGKGPADRGFEFCQ